MTGVAAISELPPQSNFKLGMLNELRIHQPIAVVSGDAAGV